MPTATPDLARQRFKLTVAYRGTHYHGWQRQRTPPNWKGAKPPEGQGIPTVQEFLQNAISRVVNHRAICVGSSRTDAGVHAKGQVVHFDTDKAQIPCDGLRRAINHKLPEDILVRAIEPVSNAFNAIGSTASKRYQYFIWHSLDRPLFFPDLAWHRWQELDVDAMSDAARLFEGQHDFASFARPGHGRDNTVRTIYSCQISYRPPRLVIGVEGSGFLWHMIRIMVGTLAEVGLGRRKPEEISQIIAARNRQAAGPTAPPLGLYLQWVKSREGAATVEESEQEYELADE